MIKTITAERRHVLLAATALVLVGYLYLTPPVSQSSIAAWLGFRTGLTVQFEMYLQRFALAFILLGVVPVSAARICGYKLRDLGLRKPACPHVMIWLVGALIAGVAIGVIGSLSVPLSNYYPYDSALAEKVDTSGGWPFLAHAAYYGFLFYLPWEIVFRGVLIFPLFDDTIDNIAPTGRTLFLASIQVIPSSLLHFGHPAVETVGAVFFGFFAGWITVRTRSIIPALIVHAASGIFLDLALVLGAG
jgi:membrane protease YdiL (CAAX protease family)